MPTVSWRFSEVDGVVLLKTQPSGKPGSESQPKGWVEMQWPNLGRQVEEAKLTFLCFVFRHVFSDPVEASSYWRGIYLPESTNSLLVTPRNTFLLPRPGCRV